MRTRDSAVTALIWLTFASGASAGPAGPEGPGGLLGWVEDSRGDPVSGAIVSVFGRGLGRSGLVTLSDSAGRFFVASLPAGSYTVRTQGAGHLPAALRRVTVLPNREQTFTVSLTPVGEGERERSASESKESKSAEDEWVWLLRHKRRSVLEEREHAASVLDQEAAPQANLLASWLSGMGGSVELVANPLTLGDDTVHEANLGMVRLKGRLAESGRWSLSGLLSEHQGAAWRMAGEFSLGPVEGHEIQAGSGYGTRLLRPQLATLTQSRTDGRGVGALFLQDRWQATESVAATFGARFSYIGFIEDSNYLDPILALEFQRDATTRVRAAVSRRTLVPGGDLLSLSSLATAPAVAFAVMDPGLRPERALRCEFGLEQDYGETSVRAQAFYEDVEDQLHNSFDGPSTALNLRISNGGSMAARGMGLTVARRFGDVMRGSMTYTYGHAWRAASLTDASLPAAPGSPWQRDFHDVAARIETAVESTDTRLVAFYRLNGMLPTRTSTGGSVVWNRRFDVQLSQGLPFLSGFTRAEWDFLVAVRNLYYEPSEGAMLDEVVVANPPKRVLGGIAVRF